MTQRKSNRQKPRDPKSGPFLTKVGSEWVLEDNQGNVIARGPDPGALVGE